MDEVRRYGFIVIDNIIYNVTEWVAHGGHPGNTNGSSRWRWEYVASVLEYMFGSLSRNLKFHDYIIKVTTLQRVEVSPLREFFHCHQHA